MAPNRSEDSRFGLTRAWDWTTGCAELAELRIDGILVREPVLGRKGYIM